MNRRWFLKSVGITIAALAMPLPKALPPPKPSPLTPEGLEKTIWTFSYAYRNPGWPGHMIARNTFENKNMHREGEILCFEYDIEFK